MSDFLHSSRKELARLHNRVPKMCSPGATKRTCCVNSGAPYVSVVFRRDSSDKVSEVEEQVDEGLEYIFLHLPAEEGVPRKCSAECRHHEHVIQAKHRADTDAEERKREVLNNVQSPVDQLAMFGELHQTSEAKAEEDPDDRPEHSLIHNAVSSAISESLERNVKGHARN